MRTDVDFISIILVDDDADFTIKSRQESLA